MSRPRRISEGEVIRVKALYLQHPEWNATELWRKDHTTYSRSKYEQWVREVGRELPPLRIYSESEIAPWDDEWPTSPESVTALFRAHRVRLQNKQFRLTPSVRDWVLKLHRVISGPSEHLGCDVDFELVQYATAYALREAACKAMNKPFYTSDLDGKLAFRIWESPENHRAWLQAVEDGIVPRTDVGDQMADVSIATVQQFILYLWQLTWDLMLIADKELDGTATSVDLRVKERRLRMIEKARETPNGAKAWEEVLNNLETLRKRVEV